MQQRLYQVGACSWLLPMLLISYLIWMCVVNLAHSAMGTADTQPPDQEQQGPWRINGETAG